MKTILLLMIVAGFLANVSAGDDYFPLAVGNHWESNGTAVYNGNTITTKDSVVLVSDTLIGGVLFYREEMHEKWTMGFIPVIDTVFKNLVTDSGSNKIVRYMADGSAFATGYHHPEETSDWTYIGDVTAGGTVYSDCYSYENGDTSLFLAPKIGIIKLHISDTTNSTVYDRELYKYHAVSTDAIKTVEFLKMENPLFKLNMADGVVKFLPIKIDDISIKIFNGNGRRLFFLKRVGSRRLDISSLFLPSGNYILEVENSTHVAIGRFSVMK